MMFKQFKILQSTFYFILDIIILFNGNAASNHMGNAPTQHYKSSFYISNSIPTTHYSSAQNDISSSFSISYALAVRLNGRVLIAIYSAFICIVIICRNSRKHVIYFYVKCYYEHKISKFSTKRTEDFECFSSDISSGFCDKQ